MKVLQISAGLIKIPPERGGGVEEMLFSLARYLAHVGHNVTVVDGKFMSSEPTIEHIDGVKIVRLGASSFSFRFLRFLDRYTGIRMIVSSVLGQVRFGLKVRSYLARVEDYDIIHVHPLVVAFVVTLFGRKWRRKTVYTSHVGGWLLHSPTLYDKLGFTLERYVIRRVGKTTVLNELVRSKIAMAARCDPDDIKTIPVGVDTSIFKPDINYGNIREKYNLDSRNIILFVGRISPDKGVEHLIRAANIVVNHLAYREMYFILVGPIAGFGARQASATKYYHKVLGLIGNCGLRPSVKIIGLVSHDDLRRLYQVCDIFVLPSVVESTPQVTVQAMASGKPVIGTRVGGIIDQIKDGWNGFLIQPGNEQELAEKIKYLIDHPEERERMGANGRRLAQEEFDWEKVTKKLLKVYQFSSIYT